MLTIPSTLELLDEIDYEDAGIGGGILHQRLPVFVGRNVALPPRLDGLVLTSDLQGMEPLSVTASPRPLGRLVADRLEELSQAQKIPSTHRMGLVLAGDLYSVPDLSRRGGSGLVDSIWLEFADRFRWVTGVLGNHDELQRREDLEARENIHLLDGETRNVDGMTIAGVGGIMGRPTKLNRKTPEHFLGLLRTCIDRRPDLMVLHEGPSVEEVGLRGSPEIRKILEETPPQTVVFGHCHWPDPVRTIADTILLNVDARVILLLRADRPATKSSV